MEYLKLLFTYWILILLSFFLVSKKISQSQNFVTTKKTNEECRADYGKAKEYKQQSSHKMSVVLRINSKRECTKNHCNVGVVVLYFPFSQILLSGIFFMNWFFFLHFCMLFLLGIAARRICVMNFQFDQVHAKLMLKHIILYQI